MPTLSSKLQNYHYIITIAKDVQATPITSQGLKNTPQIVTSMDQEPSQPNNQAAGVHNISMCT